MLLLASWEIVTLAVFFLAENKNTMYKIVHQDACMCRPGESKGVVPVSLTAKDNIEIWASCDEKPDTAYEFGCNHMLIAEGETVSLPEDAVTEYDKNEGLHMHVRARSSTPHLPLKNIKWDTIPLKSCECASQKNERADRDELGQQIADDRFDHLFHAAV